MAKKKRVVPAIGEIVGDALQPPAKEIGRELAPLGGEIGSITTRIGRVILAPVKGIVWGAENVVSFIENKVADRLAEVPRERIVEPDTQVAALAIQALQVCGHKEELADMFANLLASSVDADFKKRVHPGFVDVIKHLSRVDAIIVKEVFSYGDEMPAFEIRYDTDEGKAYYIEIDHFNADLLDSVKHVVKSDYEFVQLSIDNLERLGLIQALHDQEVADDDKYGLFEKHQVIKKIKKKHSESKIDFGRGLIRLTQFGRAFGSTCIRNTE
jgi:hypothetical protein